MMILLLRIGKKVNYYFSHNSLYKMNNTLRVYKSAKDYIIELIINKSDRNNLRRRVYNKKYAKYRTEKAFVDKIYNKFNNQKELEEIESDFNSSFVYKKGQYITDYYNPDIGDVCTNGIHFYLTLEAAYYHNFYDYLHPGSGSYTGKYKSWFDNGRPLSIIQYNEGLINGVYIGYNIDGVLVTRTNFKNGIRNGLVEYWYDNRNPKEKFTVINEHKQGTYENWYENGQLRTRCSFKGNSVYDGVYESWHKDGKPDIMRHYKDGELIN